MTGYVVHTSVVFDGHRINHVYGDKDQLFPTREKANTLARKLKRINGTHEIEVRVHKVLMDYDLSDPE